LHTYFAAARLTREEEVLQEDVCHAIIEVTVTSQSTDIQEKQAK
jgi:hypothetical protein